MSKTLFFYISKHNFKWIFLTFLGLSSLAFIINSIEQTRRALSRVKLDFFFELKLSLLQLPKFMELLLPFSVLFGAMLSISFLNRHHEIIMARASGISLRQFIMPCVFVAFIYGLFSILVLNPISSNFKKHHEFLVNTVIKGKETSIEMTANGFWLHTKTDQGYQVIHATEVIPPLFTMIRVYFLDFDHNHQLIKRIDGQSALLGQGQWNIQNAWVSTWGNGQKSEYLSSNILPTKLTHHEIINALAPADSIAIWDLPHFISMFKAHGFPTRDHELQFNGFLSTPLLFIALVIFGSLFSIYIPRFGTNFWGFAIGVGIGFLIYILDQIFFSLGGSGALPIWIATWTPAIATSLFSFSWLIHREEK